ncbi:MAG: ribonuclease P protein component [Candidatus Marinamargulisbacteria bacterium]|jgi:ribonuclease P protein component|nr:ribonuclease P protein component [bacterium]MDG2264903.1 ribonuclease P protein component [Candidatus Marinamargulisbacteria bacterium]|tara:strand:+ start:310 stop:654 length:345 start_codon:yes stop_codon:yes gene_type:complete
MRWVPFTEGSTFRHHFSIAIKRFYFTTTTVHIAPCLTSHCQFSVVISKKASKKAVTRNRFRRQLKDWYRTHQLNRYGHNIIVVVRPALKPQTATTIDHDFSRVHHWLKIHCKID